MKLLRVVMLGCLVASANAHAADLAGITVNGEVAFDYNFLSTKDNGIPNTGAATNETYRLNSAQILLKKETDQINFLARLAYLPTSVVTTAAPEAKTTYNLGTLDQIEAYYKVTPQFHIGFGRFLTTMGYESLLKSENSTYNNTIAYQSIVPGYGEGLRLRYIAGDWLTATLSTYNQSTYSAWGDDYTPTKTTELSATGVLGNFTWFGGYYLGTDSGATAKVEKSASSVWAAYKFADNFSLAITYDSRTFTPDGEHAHWADSTSAVLSYGLNQHNLALRYEMVRGANELVDPVTFATYGNADKVNSLTVTDKIALTENFKVYAEYRMDQADEDVFADEDGNANSKKDASMITLGAIASF